MVWVSHWACAELPPSSTAAKSQADLLKLILVTLSKAETAKEGGQKNLKNFAVFELVESPGQIVSGSSNESVLRRGFTRPSHHGSNVDGLGFIRSTRNHLAQRE